MKAIQIKTTEGDALKFRGEVIAKTGDVVSVKFYDTATVPDTDLFHSATIYKTDDNKFVVEKRFFTNYRDWEPECKATFCESQDEALNWLRANDDEQRLTEILKYE